MTPRGVTGPLQKTLTDGLREALRKNRERYGGMLFVGDVMRSFQAGCLDYLISGGSFREGLEDEVRNVLYKKYSSINQDPLSEVFEGYGFEVKGDRVSNGTCDMDVNGKAAKAVLFYLEHQGETFTRFDVHREVLVSESTVSSAIDFLARCPSFKLKRDRRPNKIGFEAVP